MRLEAETENKERVLQCETEKLPVNLMRKWSSM